MLSTTLALPDFLSTVCHKQMKSERWKTLLLQHVPSYILHKSNHPSTCESSTNSNFETSPKYPSFLSPAQTESFHSPSYKCKSAPKPLPPVPPSPQKPQSLLLLLDLSPTDQVCTRPLKLP